MKNRYLKELNSLKKPATSRLFQKKFRLPNLNISSIYHNYSNDVFQIMDDIYQELKVDSLITGLLGGKEVNYTEKRPALHHRYRSLFLNKNDFDAISTSKFFQKL